jgi:hypothetical protein
MREWGSRKSGNSFETVDSRYRQYNIGAALFYPCRAFETGLLLVRFQEGCTAPC